MFIRLHSSDVSPIIKSDHACPDNSTHGIHFFTQYTTFFYYGYSSRGHGNLRSFKDHQGFRIMVYDAGSGIMGGINGTNIQSRGVRRISICDRTFTTTLSFSTPTNFTSLPMQLHETLTRLFGILIETGK
jgi:hypothetical protein